MFLWWLMAQHQLQLSSGSRGVMLCASAPKTCVHICLEGGIPLMNTCCADRVCVWGRLCVQSHELRDVAFVGVCICSAYIRTCVYLCAYTGIS